MMKRILTRYPRNWPYLNLKWILICLAIYYTLDSFALGFAWFFQVPIPAELRQALQQPQSWMLKGFLVFMGLVRVFAPHPDGKTKYRNWLKTTPWHPGMPLPLGPITLNFYDLVLLAVTGFMFTKLGMHAELAVLLFGVAYTIAVMLKLLSTGPARIDYLLSLGLLVMFWALPDVRVAALIVVAMYPIEYWAIRHSLKSFPWEPQVPKHVVPLGWTFERLGPEPVKVRVPFFDAVIVSLLFGGSVYVTLSKSFADARRTIEVFLVLAGFFAALIRFGVYCGGSSNPLGLRARIATGRLIIPRFDQVLVAPLLLAALLATSLVVWIQRPVEPIEAGTFAALIVFILFGMGPSLRRFRLTGAYNISQLSSRASRQRLSAQTTSE